tara:strand:+ start:848 stop:1306 length:459 start_codon:yes stop_codon:yes gene_type:complete
MGLGLSQQTGTQKKKRKLIKKRAEVAEAAEESRQDRAKQGQVAIGTDKGPKETTLTTTYRDPSIYQLGKMAPQLTRPGYSRYFTETVTPSGTEVKALYDRRKIAAAEKLRGSRFGRATTNAISATPMTDAERQYLNQRRDKKNEAGTVWSSG